MCDRVYVVADGQIKAELERGELSQETIRNYATGGTVV